MYKLFGLFDPVAGARIDSRRDEDLAIAERGALTHQELAAVAFQIGVSRGLGPDVFDHAGAGARFAGAA